MLKCTARFSCEHLHVRAPSRYPHIEGKFSPSMRPLCGFFDKFFSNMDPIRSFWGPSIRKTCLPPTSGVGMDNMALTEYLIGQLLESPKARFACALASIFRNASRKDWRVERCRPACTDLKGPEAWRYPAIRIPALTGQRILHSPIRAMLGPSPGASTAVCFMLEVIKRCFPENSRP